jgi:putative flavoprotein involved in K+ transport
LDLARAGVTAAIWATNFRRNFGWLRVDTFSPNGAPHQHRGVAVCPGSIFSACLGRAAAPRRLSGEFGPWPTYRIAGHIATDRRYQAYRSGVDGR